MLWQRPALGFPYSQLDSGIIELPHPIDNWPCLPLRPLPAYQGARSKFPFLFPTHLLFPTPRSKAQIDAGRADCFAKAKPREGSLSSRTQAQTDWQQGQPQHSEQGLPMPGVRDLCQLWDTTQTGKQINLNSSSDCLEVCNEGHAEFWIFLKEAF